MATPNDAAPPAPAASSSSAPAPPAAEYENALMHNWALVMTPVALGALFLPPRRLDVRQLVLGGSALWGVNQLAYDYRGESVLQKYGVTPNPKRLAAGEHKSREAWKEKWGTLEPLPSERAAQMQARIRAEKAARERARTTAAATAGLSDAERAAREAEEEKRRAARDRTGRSPLEQLWMGDADDDWREKRDRREREALKDGGGGYWGLISDQIGEVWSGGAKKTKKQQEEEEEEAARARQEGDEKAGKKSSDGKNGA